MQNIYEEMEKKFQEKDKEYLKKLTREQLEEYILYVRRQLPQISAHLGVDEVHEAWQIVMDIENKFAKLVSQ